MQLLDAVNLIMPKLGERPVTSLEVKHPTLAVLLPVVEQARRTLLKRGWWFNEFPNTTLYPDINSELLLGTDTLSFIPDCEGVAVTRGDKLFNPVTRTTTFTVPVKGRLITDVEFDELPESAAHFVMYSALLDAFTTDIGVSQELQVWQSSAQHAWSDLMAEHLRQVKHTTRKSRRWRQMIWAMRS